MATKLSKPVTRVVTLKDTNGTEGEVAVTMTGSGLVFHKGRRKFPVIPWAAIGKLAPMAGNMPAKFVGNPLGWLVELGK